MATFSPFSFLFLFLLSSLLISTSSARPCKTLFYFSTNLNSYPSSNPYPFSQIHKPRYFTLVLINPNPTVDQQTHVNDRTMDIMSVIGALLFGVGCGALTASVMYFIWAIFFSNRDVDFDVVAVSDEDDNDDDFDDEEIAAKKKGFGYVKVAAGDE